MDYLLTDLYIALRHLWLKHEQLHDIPSGTKHRSNNGAKAVFA